MGEVFTIRDGEWQARINGKVLPTIWNDKGAALAGLQVEMRRNAPREPKAGEAANALAKKMMPLCADIWDERFTAATPRQATGAG